LTRRPGTTTTFFGVCPELFLRRLAGEHKLLDLVFGGRLGHAHVAAQLAVHL
jgi:hypothetical protein